MKYIGFGVNQYKGVTSKIEVILRQLTIAPILGKNNSGKSSFLKGVCAFDYRNDAIKEFTQHLSDITPLTTKNDQQFSTLTATVEFTSEELINELLLTLYRHYPTTLTDNIRHFVPTLTNNIQDLEDFLSHSRLLSKVATKQKHLFKLDLERHISFDNHTSYYHCDIFSHQLEIRYRLGKTSISIPIRQLMSGIPKKNSIEIFCLNIMKKLPRIVFYQDFSQHPFPSKLWLDNCDASKKMDPWYAIFGHIFNQHNQNIDTLIELSQSQRDELLTNISYRLNRGLINYFDQFGIGKHCPQIKFTYKQQVLTILIGDRDSDHYTRDIYQKDKSTLWYLDFILKMVYLNKIDLSANNVFIFDNVGSYLSAEEQVELCKNISFLARKNKVLYSSMSHHLYNLGYIQLKSIYLLNKTKAKQTLSLIKKSPSIKHVGSELMLQSIFEVLNLSNLDYFFAIDRPILLVEGMSDKFYFDTFLPKSTLDKFYIVASQGASTLYKNVQYFIAFNKPFIVLSDFDEAGIQGLEKCKDLYRSYPKGGYLHLPKLHGDKPVRIEDMLSVDTRNLITDTLGLDRKVYKKSLIFTLYRSDKNNITTVQNGVSTESQNNFNNLAQLLEDELSRIKNQD